MTTWHVIPVKAENVLPNIEKIVPIMHATNHQNSGVINVIVTSSFNLPKKRNDLDTVKKNEMLASNNYSDKASLCQRWTLMN